MPNLSLALQLLTQLLGQVASVGAVIKNAADSGKDLTADDLKQITDANAAALAKLNADIAAHSSPP